MVSGYVGEKNILDRETASTGGNMPAASKNSRKTSVARVE